MWRSEIKFMWPSSVTLYVALWGRNSHRNLVFAEQLTTARDPEIPRSSPSHSCHHVQLLTPGTKLWSPCLQDKRFGNRTISASFSPFSIVNLPSNMNSGFNKIVFNKHDHFFFSIQLAFCFVRRLEALCSFCSKYDEGNNKERESKPGAGEIQYGFIFLCCISWQCLHQWRNTLVNFRPCFPFTRLNCQFSVDPSLMMLCQSILTLRKDSFHNVFAWHNSVIRAVCKALFSLISFTREQLAVWRIFNAAVTQHVFCCGFCLGTCKGIFFFFLILLHRNQREFWEKWQG